MVALKMSFLVLFLWPTLLPGHDGETVDDERIERRYEDLLEGADNERFLKVFLDPGYAHAKQRPPEEWVEIDWAREKGVNAFPVLLEVLRREPNVDPDIHPHPWIGVERKMHVLNWVSSHSNGNPQSFVEEVRRQLPEWSERQIANHDMHTGFIREALHLLAREGDDGDIPLIKSFLNDANRNNRHNAEKSLIKLEERLGSESARTRRPPPGNKRTDSSQSDALGRPSQQGNFRKEDGEDNEANWFFLIVGVFVGGTVILLIRAFFRGRAS